MRKKSPSGFRLESLSQRISTFCCGPRDKEQPSFLAKEKLKEEAKIDLDDLMSVSIDNFSDEENGKQAIGNGFDNHVLKPIKKAITKVVRPWEKKEDVLLLELVDKHNGHHWKEIANAFPGRTAPECNKRWKKLRPVKKRKPWDQSEDSHLLSLVDQFGLDWAAVSSKMPGRSGKQVRERYLNTLDPNINRKKWTKQEDEIILQMFYHRGSKWKDISKMLVNRPENMVKNRFYCHIKKKMLRHEIDMSGEFDTSEYTSELSVSIRVDAEGGRSPEIGDEFLHQDVLGAMQNGVDYIKMEEEPFDNGLERMEQENQEGGARRMKKEGSIESISGYLDMIEESQDNEPGLELAIQEVDDRLRQAYYILNNSLATGGGIDLSMETTNLKMTIEALSSKKQELMLKKNGINNFQ
jgi:Myb-like DNA-binding domain